MKRPLLKKAIIGGVVLGGLITLGIVFDVATYLRQAMVWIDGLGFTGVFLFIGLYALCTVLLIPGTVPTLAAGAIFGLGQGLVYVSLGSTIGAFFAFLIGRYFARDSVQKAVSTNPTFAAIDSAIGNEGWKIVGLMRLSPLVPFSLSNYFYGITAVKTLPYVLVSWIAMLPGTVMYVYIGTVVGLAASGSAVGMTPGRLILTIVGLLATVAVSVMVTRIAKKAIKERGITGETTAETKLAATDEGCEDSLDIRVPADLKK